jgi:carbon monoxide dehydrogenase subunit G
MKLAAQQRIAAPRERVWEGLNDPQVLRASIPGCQSLDKVADDRFTATVEVKLGPIGALFKGTVSLTDLDPLRGYTLLLQGSGGIAGSMKGTARVHLSEASGGTLISYEVEAQVGGRMAQLGGPLIDATAEQLAAKFFTRFGEIVAGAAADAQPTTDARSPSVPPPANVALRSPANGGWPMAWILATVVAALTGFLVGRNQHGAGSDWAGVAIGLLLIVTAGVAFEYGRRAAAPVVVLDDALLSRLSKGTKE